MHFLMHFWLKPQASSRHTFRCGSMLAVVLVLCAWRLCHSGESCSHTRLYGTVGLVGLGLKLGWRARLGRKPTATTANSFGIGVKASNIPATWSSSTADPRYAATLSVEIFLGDELVKSCIGCPVGGLFMGPMLQCPVLGPWARRQDVRFKYTCHYSGDEYQTCQVSLYAEVNRLTTTMTMTRTVTNTTMPEEVGMATQWHIPVTAFAGFMSCLFA